MNHLCSLDICGSFRRVYLFGFIFFFYGILNVAGEVMF